MGFGVLDEHVEANSPPEEQERALEARCRWLQASLAVLEKK